MPVRVIEWPDRTIQAFGGDTGQTASALEGITLQFGDRTVPAPQAARIYRLSRIESNTAEAARTLAMYLGVRTIAQADLQDFLFLLDDTISGGGVPAMASGEQWTISFTSISGGPDDELLRRLTDRSESYGNYSHYTVLDRAAARAPAGAGGTRPPRGLRAEYTRTGGGSGERSVVETMAQMLVGFFHAALPDQRRDARTAVQYREVFSRGYVSFTNARPQDGGRFMQAVSQADPGQVIDAAARAMRVLSGEVPGGRQAAAQEGMRQFLEEQRTYAQLDAAIEGRGLTTTVLTPDVTRGFQSFDIARRRSARQAANTWRTEARAALSSRGSGLVRLTRQRLESHIENAYTLYLAALAGPDNVPASCRATYFGYLAQRPSGIWGAYKAALNPASRAMAERMVFMILVAWDPTSSEPPPPSAGGAYLGTLRSFFVDSNRARLEQLLR